MIDILNRWTRAVVFHSETAATIAEAVLECQKRASEAGERADLRGADLQGAHLQGADLRGADLQGADLQRAYLQRAYLQGADLQRAYLQGADLQRAYLRGAYLQGAHLQRARLRGAYLQGADLQRAYLQGAHLQGAHLQGADLQDAHLQGAKGLLPNGIVLLQIGGSRHWIIVREPGHITIGCEHHSTEWWEEHYAEIGAKEGYTAAQIAEYRRHIAYCREWMALNGVEAPIDKEAPIVP